MPTHWPQAAVSIIVFRDDYVLLGQRAKPPLTGVWSLPGGRIEPGEPLRTAALRELNEETGVSATITGLADTRDIITHDDAGHLSAHYVVTVFIGVWTKGEPRAASDCLDAAWVRITDLANYGMTEGTKALIEHVWETMVQATDCT